MSPRALTLTLVAMLAAPNAAPAAEEAPVLRFDPFTRPELVRSSGEERRAAPEWAPVLRSTLVAGADSLANLGGDVLRIGEETHGYRLLRVDRFSATFEREGTELELRLHPVEEERP